MVSLLSRSLGISPQIVRKFHSSMCSNASKQTDKNNKPSSADSKEKGASTGDGPSSTGGSNGNKNDNDDKIKSVLTKTIMWMFTIYMFVAFISLIMSPRSERPEVNIKLIC